jgi:carbon-monoxide dehydrogenase medium subunit
MPVRLANAEALLHQKTITLQLAADASDAATADLDFLDDARGSAAYRRDMARVQIRRSIELHFGLGYE